MLNKAKVFKKLWSSQMDLLITLNALVETEFLKEYICLTTMNSGIHLLLIILSVQNV